MDPLTILGGVAASAQLLNGLQTAAFGVIELYRGIRDINESTRSLHEQLEALQFVLFLLGNEASRIALRSTVPAAVQHGDSLRNVLVNAGKTLTRLEEISKDIAQTRKVGAQLRQYLCARSYDVTLRDLRERLVQYVQIINIALTTISMSHSQSKTAAGEQPVYIQVVTNHVNVLEESQTRLVGAASAAMPTPPSTPPGPNRDPNDPDVTPRQSNQSTLPSAPGGYPPVHEPSAGDSGLVTENLELIAFGRTIVSSIRAVTSTMGTEAGAPTVRGGSVLSSDLEGSTLHPQADTISLHPIFTRQSKNMVASYINQLDKDLQSGLTSGGEGPERDDGVPTDFDRRVVKATLTAARKHASEKCYDKALVPLEILLRKGRAFAFFDDGVEKEVTHLMATALVHSGCPDDFRSHILRLYPIVAQDLVLVGFEMVKKLVTAGNLTGAISYLDTLLSYPQNYPDMEIMVPDDAPSLMATCLAKAGLPSKAETAMAIRFPEVDHRLTVIQTETALDHLQNYQPLKNRHLDKGRLEEELAIVRQWAGLVQRAIKGWERYRLSHKLGAAEETKFNLLRITFANLLTDDDAYHQDSEQVLLYFAQDPHLDIKVRAKAEHSLAQLYLRRVEEWREAREHAEKAARLYSKTEISGSEYATSIELFARTCELLGDPEGMYTLDELPPGWERTILPTHLAFQRTRHYLTEEMKRNRLDNVPDKVPDKAASLAVEFLKHHYVHDFLNTNGSRSEACWSCIDSSLKNAPYPFVGHLGAEDLCLQRKCLSRPRYPVLEYLAASRPAVMISGSVLHKSSTVATLLSIMRELLRRRKDNPSLPLVDFTILLRLAVVNGNQPVIQLLFDQGEYSISELAFPNQVAHIKDGIVSLADFMPWLSYEEAVKTQRRQRSADESQALEVLVRQLSAEGLATTLRQTFLPRSIWDHKALAFMMTCYLEQGVQEFKDGTILRNVLFNAATFLGASVRKDSDPLLQLANKLLRTFAATGRQVRAAIGAQAWEQVMDRVTLQLTSRATDVTSRCDELTSKAAAKDTEAASDDMVVFLSNICLNFRREVDRSPGWKPPARNKKKGKGLWPW